MSELQFDNEDDLAKWLETQPQGIAITIAARATLRTLPLINVFLYNEPKSAPEKIFLPIFRATLVTNSARWGISKLKVTGLYSAQHTQRAQVFSKSIQFNDPKFNLDDTFGALFTVYSTHNAIVSAIDPGSTIACVKDIVATALRMELHAKRSTVNMWNNILADANHGLVTPHDDASLWCGERPDWILSHWQNLRTALLSAEDEDWGVWIDWYEARLRGDPVNLDLNRAIALIPDEIWEQGPTVANAEIRRLIDEDAAKRRDKAEEQVSPAPLINADGKLDAGPNPGIDIPDDSPNLPELLRRQHANIAIIMDAVATLHGNDLRTAPRALTRYDDEVTRNRLRLSIDYLNDMRAIARSEYLSLYRDAFFDGEAGLRRTFLNFFALHKEIQTHYPLDADRRIALELFGNPTERPDPAALEAAIEDVTEGLTAALDAEAMTAEYDGYMRGMMRDIADIGYTPPLAGMAVEKTDPQLTDPPSPRMRLAKQLYLKVAAFAGASVRAIKREPVGFTFGIIALAASPAGAAFLSALERLSKFLWALF